MKKLQNTDFQYEAGIVDADILLTSGLSTEAVALYCSRVVSLFRKGLLIILTKSDIERVCVEKCRLVDIFYSQCQKAADLSDNPHLNIQILFKSPDFSQPNYVEVTANLPQISYEPRPNQVVVPFPQMMPLMLFNPLPPITRSFKRVLFAGTFDHLHAGHKSVLTQALFMADETLYIAVASQELLTRKKSPSALEPFDLRVRSVLTFLKDVAPDCKKGVEIRMLETPDAIGPAGWLELDCLIVTPETKGGGENVNTARLANDKPVVEIVVCSILGSMDVENKVSSTGTRMRLAMGDHLPFLSEHFKKSIMHRMDEKLGQVWWSKLRDMYGLEPWRRFHDLRHVHELLLGADEHYGNNEVSPLEIALCIWFHDCVYSPRSPRNEEDSVGILDKFNKVAGFPGHLVEMVNETIMLTMDHRNALRREDLVPWQKVFLELDLSILGSDFDRYKEYSEQIRREYQHFPDQVFNLKRRDFLMSMKDFTFSALKNAKQLNSHLSQNLSWELQKIE